MEETLYTDLIAKYLSGNCTDAERATLWAWVEAGAEHRRFFDQAVQLWGLSSEATEAAYVVDTQLAWGKLEGRLFGEATQVPMVALQPSNKSRNLSIKRVWMAAAAVILLVIAVSIWWSQAKSVDDQLVIYETQAQERRAVALPDGSKIWLNEKTRLTFNQAFAPRVVELNGEAFFEVRYQNGNPFRILSGGAATTVLGTSFNVRAYPNETKVEVTVATGKVALQNTDNETDKVLLVPGKSGIFDKQTQTVTEVTQPIENADAWKTQRLDFRNSDTRAIVAALERYFDVQIAVENPAIYNCNLSMTQPLDHPKLTDIFEQMQFLWNIEIVKKDNVYVIHGEGCK